MLAVVVVLVVVLVVVALVKAIHVVQQGNAAIVERFGRHIRTLDPGLSVIVPFIDRVRYRINLREQIVPFPPQPVITQDNLVVHIDTVVHYRVTDAWAATYKVTNYIAGMEQLTVTTLRSIVGRMDLEQTLASREEINAALRGVLDEATGEWGIRVNRVQLKAIEPPTSIQDALEKQIRADHDKRAAILQAEGEKRAALLRAETEREVAALLRQEADTKVVKAPEPGAHTPPLPAPAWEQPLPLREEDPARLGRYVLRARLGQGGMGTVYLGHTPGGRLVAVKVLRRGFADDPGFRQRFAREVQTARRVGGFYTAQVVDADPEAERPWLVSEFIPGPTLREVLRQHGALPARSLYALAAGVAEGLAGIHACGIIHRDLKPGNIIVAEAGPRIIDFGIARALDSTALTSTHQVVGTQGFLAPEQLRGEKAGFAADVYAFGAVLCHAAGAGDEPLASALAMLPSSLQGIVARCRDDDPAGRPTASGIVDGLSGHVDLASEGWLPPALRTVVGLHARTTMTS
ncbi:SPFH domain-containing protein [Streptomyces sp. 6N223]|uniref:SPFH domain-containing protein n=1 Tax=Streptomyces sp. 6N223 TaxID=3457412 RepID=UPI003FCF6C49